MTVRNHSLRGYRGLASLALLLAATPVNGQSIRIKQLSSTDRVVDNVQVLIVNRPSANLDVTW
jgi:hypothetical protein